jgi:glycosyltransferase involved in cell wall biosynthesis
VEDGSTDRSREVVESVAAADPRVRIVDGPRAGIAMSLNAGIAAARGEIIARCDSDDQYEPDRLRWQVEWLNTHPDFGAICAAFSMIDPKGRHVTTPDTGLEACEITDELRNGKTRTHFCTYATRAEFLRQISGSRAWFEHAEDIDLQLRLGETCRVWYEPRRALLYRIHGTSITHVQPNERRLYLDQAARDFQKERRAGRLDPVQRGDPPTPPGGEKRDGSTAMSASAHLHHLLVGRAWQEHAQGHRGRAVMTGLRALAAAPGRWRAWKTVAALLLARRAGRAGE